MNADPDHIPAPAEHAPTVEARIASGDLRNPQRFTLEEDYALSSSANAWMTAVNPVDVVE